MEEIKKGEQARVSLTKCIAEILNKIPVSSLDGRCPDWIGLEIENGKIQDVTIKKICQKGNLADAKKNNKL